MHIYFLHIYSVLAFHALRIAAMDVISCASEIFDDPDGQRWGVCLQVPRSCLKLTRTFHF